MFRSLLLKCVIYFVIKLKEKSGHCASQLIKVAKQAFAKIIYFLER